MATYATDAFTDTAATLLSAHAPTGGVGTWALHPTTVNTLQISDLGRVRCTTTTSTGMYTLSGLTIPSADYEVQGTFFVQTVVTSSYAMLGRWDSTAATGYAVFYTPSSTQWSLQRANAGSFTLLGSAVTQVLSNATGYTVKLRMQGNDISMFVDGSQIIGPITDASPISVTGRPGLRWVGPATNNTGLQFDDLLVQDIPAAAPGGGYLNRSLLGVG